MVNIDTVYQRVLAIANKEQRGYITPLEYNLLANQAQLSLFEQYFYDRHKVAQIPGSKINHSDIDSMLDEKISLFERRDIGFTSQLPGDLYRLDSVLYRQPDPNPGQKTGRNSFEATEVSAKEWLYIQHSPLLQPTNTRPIYIRQEFNRVFVHGTNNILLSPLACNYIKQPDRVEWGYDVIGEKALYNASPNKTTHFQHHAAEETELVMRILELAGVIIEDPNVVQYANKKVTEKTQAKK
tara:strand:+ start:195 stop:914 length:720 start_codon:yes stop_codon:yes gene_type:complete